MSEKISVSKKTIKKQPTGGDKSRTLKVVALRNRFFYMLYRNSILVFLSSLTSLLVAILFLFTYAREPVAPQYIPINVDGTLIKLVPLTEEKPEAEVQKFALDAIKKLFKYDYINYPDQIQEAVSSFFTSDGYNEYLDGYAKADTLSAIKENHWIVSVEVKSVPTILRKELINNVFTWELKVPIQILYIGNKGKTQKGDLYLRIERDSVVNNPNSLGISKAIFKETK